MDALLRHVRHSLRGFARTPGFTIAVVLTFAIGIGANSAVFSALDAVLLRALPYPDSDRLVALSHTRERSPEDNVAPLRLRDWRDRASGFEAMTGHYTEDVSETSGDLPERLRRATVAAQFLEVLRVSPLLGRGFTADEYTGSPSAVVMISERFWRTRFKADPNIAGRQVRIDTAPATIVGVLPSSVAVPDRNVALWRPHSVDDPAAQSRAAVWYTVLGRLAPGVSLEQARGNLESVQAGLAEQFPDTDSGLTLQVVPFKDIVVARARNSLWLLFGAVSAVLLVACTNVATLLLTRTGQRRRDVALRLSLGATSRSIAVESLVETCLLAVAGAAVGLLIAMGAGRAIRLLAADLPRVEEIALNGRVLAYALGAVVVTTVVAGFLPAWRAARATLAETLASASRSQLSTRHPTQWLLVGVQVALCVALLTSAGLLVRSARELSQVDPGFEPARVLAFRLSFSFAESSDYARVQQRMESTLEALAAMPGVDAVATSQRMPGVPARSDVEFDTPDGRIDPAAPILAAQNFVSPGYFATLGIPLVGGELCRSTPGRRDLLVNRAFADAYLPGAAAGAALGLELRQASGGPLVAAGSVVGIVGNSREAGMNAAPVPAVYVCTTQNLTAAFLVRTRGEPLAISATVRARLKELEPLRSVYEITPLEQRIDAAFNENRMRTVLLAAFAAAALCLAAIGIYGTLSYVVGLGRREIGLRLALGALRGSIVRHFLFGVLRVVCAACVAGAILALLAGRGLAGMLYGVTPSDPLTLAAVIAVVIGVATVAALVPSLRAAWTDPMHALREE